MAMSIRAQALKRTLLMMLLLLFPLFFLGGFLARFLLDLLLPDEHQGITSLLWSSLFNSIAICLGMGIIGYLACRNLYDPGYSRASASDSSAYIQMRLSYHPAFDSCLISLRQLGKAAILHEDRANGVIEAAITPVTWWKRWLAWGQRVSFRLGSDQEGSTKILVTSRDPLTWSMDQEQNQRNIERITAVLRKEVEK